MSEYTKSGKRISSRHHISTQSRQAEEKQITLPASTTLTAPLMSGQHPQNLGAAAPTNTPPPYHSNNETSLATNHVSLTPPFHDNLSPISSPHPSSTALTLTQPQPQANEFGTTSRNNTTTIQNDTALLIDRISTLEADLHHERNTTTNLATTLSQERLTFEQ